MSNQLFRELSELEKIEHARRIRERRERQEQQKENNHWIFLAGAIVAKYLKEDLKISVYKGKDAAAENAASFAPLENILAYLATHKEFTAQIAAQPQEPLSPDP